MPENTVPHPRNSRRIDLTGKTFGRLKVIAYSGRKGCRLYWECLCSCGVTKPISGEKLRYGSTKSCGCLKEEQLIERTRTHGQSDTQLFGIWVSMKQRCRNTSDAAYKNYGGRGIDVCDRWLHSFEAFRNDVGERPRGLTLDRINNDGDYEPGNVRWATRKEQVDNRRQRRDARVVTFRNQTKPLSEWARDPEILKLHIPLPTLDGRLNRGWTVEKAFTTPPNAYRKTVMFNGRETTYGDLSRSYGIPRPVLFSRITYRGMTPEAAVALPYKARGKDKETSTQK